MALALEKLEAARARLPEAERSPEIDAMIAQLRGLAEAEAQLREAEAAMGPPPARGWGYAPAPHEGLLVKVRAQVQHGLKCIA